MPPLGRKSRKAALRIAEYWPRRAFNAVGTSGGPSKTNWPSCRPGRTGAATGTGSAAGAVAAAGFVAAVFLADDFLAACFFFFFFFTTFDFEDAASAGPDPFHAGTDTNETMQAMSSKDKKRFKGSSLGLGPEGARMDGAGRKRINRLILPDRIR